MFLVGYSSRSPHARENPSKIAKLAFYSNLDGGVLEGDSKATWERPWGDFLPKGVHVRRTFVLRVRVFDAF